MHIIALLLILIASIVLICKLLLIKASAKWPNISGSYYYIALAIQFCILLFLKGWLTGFFLGLIVFMGCSLACVHACFFKKRIIFHIIYLYSTPLCPFSDKRLDLLTPQKYVMGWDWLAGSVCCDSLNRLYCTSERPAPLLSGMCSGWIVNSKL